MGKLQQQFNRNYSKFMDGWASTFSDEKTLQRANKYIKEVIQKNPNTDQFHTEVYSSCQPVFDEIYKNDASLIEQDRIGFLAKLNFKHIFTKRMLSDEKKQLFSDIQSLCRFCSLLRTCGSQLTDMEEMASEFTQNHSFEDPAEYQRELFKEMLSGGAMSQKLLQTFQDPNNLKNILNNVGDVLRGTNGIGSDFSSMLKLATDMKESDIDAVSRDISSGNMGLVSSIVSSSSK